MYDGSVDYWTAIPEIPIEFGTEALVFMLWQCQVISSNLLTICYKINVQLQFIHRSLKIASASYTV